MGKEWFWKDKELLFRSIFSVQPMRSRWVLNPTTINWLRKEGPVSCTCFLHVACWILTNLWGSPEMRSDWTHATKLIHARRIKGSRSSTEKFVMDGRGKLEWQISRTKGRTMMTSMTRYIVSRKSINYPETLMFLRPKTSYQRLEHYVSNQRIIPRSGSFVRKRTE